VPAFFALVAPAALDPVMFFVSTLFADHTNLVPFCFKMLSARLFTIKMGCESKYVHLLISLTALKIIK